MARSKYGFYFPIIAIPSGLISSSKLHNMYDILSLLHGGGPDLQGSQP